MKKVFSVLVAMLLALVPAVLAVDIGGGIGIEVGTEDFVPVVWMCDNRVLVDDPIEPGDNGMPALTERINNYAFEGESVAWDVVVFDKNGAEKISDVYVTIGSVQGTGNDIEANCDQIAAVANFADCNARLDEEVLAWNANVMKAFRCTFTVETPDSMQGEYFVTVEAEDLDGLLGIFDENEYWFFNPELELYISETALDFGDDVRAGTASYSQTLLLGNNVESGSGVLLDMFIAGTDFYDPANSGAMCPVTNMLALNPVARGLVGPLYIVDGMPTGIQYYATSGAYDTDNNCGTSDAEGYVAIVYGDRIDNSQSIIDCAGYTGARDISVGAGNGNILAPGAEMALTFRLVLPEPCNGDFSSGDVFFWGEAV